ncbi:MAG: hypothetical protein MHM6MM_000335 [Cercozoa sp. M6MM]
MTFASLASRRISRSVLRPRRRWFSGEAAAEPTVLAPHIQAIVDDVCKLNLLEVAELVEGLKERLNIPDSALAGGVAMAMPVAAAETEEAPVEEEKTEFTVQLKGFDAGKKIKLIKEVRAITGLGLKEAKALVEGAPAEVKANLPKAEAEELADKLKEVGGDIELI